ncbi:DEHA2E23166p [Debaryomyces hansenii CBS767]|uniref:DEHA2E23166p n=1 Tax=Debaryomyces hansenii (strain ATCC 36239 / CBS 767 / BCRC 21394 / JCM 1990 / NBRC 0083 / IGC 2968) TaxID=284592 RepID=B5RU60_DEBHA|nr:DEHA2E23166p [Debaryomyces hansenii CBS767]CAR65872.1 DEHA2E23166p [Debaryomyces hansenii CBS767]|eukprot:XP_002770531.1 DEHA2E23166p [Debaryomyces hansenii CBS767]
MQLHFFFFDPLSEGKTFISIFVFLTSTVALINISIYHYIQKIKIYNEKLGKIVIPEFIENRPFKETNVMQKDEILAIILRNVNAKFVSTMKKQYAFKNIEQLVKFHDNIIAGFTKRYFEKYKELPLEDIQGWDRMLLIAKNIQDEDSKDVYADMVSSEIAQKYSSIRPTTQENGSTMNGE